MENSKEIICLEGSIYIGENIDDEWFIVFLFYEISKNFTNTTVSNHYMLNIFSLDKYC